MKKTAIIAISLLSILSCTPKDEIDMKVDSLLKQMTLREKIGQMNQVTGAQVKEEQILNGEIGSILNFTDPVKANAMQKIAVEQSRLGIPLIYGQDVIHGFKTIFPIPLGLAATFDPALVEKGARIAAVEASAAGVRWTFSPMLDVARDPRWGRVAEGSGEDPYLTSLMGAAMVRGYQGTEGDPSSIAACTKHFVGYGAAEGGRDYNSTIITERTLRNVYLPPFEAAVKAGAMTVMTSFNDVDGIPSTGNKWLLKDVLRDEWNFDGFVVTDWNSSGEMVAHGFATDLKDATAISVNAGVDMDMMSFGYIRHIENLVDEGKISIKDIDNAVRNILKVKFRLGLFENPYIDETLYDKVVYHPEHLEASKESALKSAILLKNDGILPLQKGTKVLVTGPLADAPFEQMGTWCFDAEKAHSVTPLTALKDYYQVSYEPGLSYSRDRNTKDLAKVTAAARRSDVVLVFVGEEAILSGEAHNLSSLDLVGAQAQLVKAAKASGKPVVIVVMAGRPLTIEAQLSDCNAMLYSFHPGTMGGPAIAELLSGDAVPSGKTPMTFLRTAGQAPTYYNHLNTGRPNKKNETLLYDIPIEAGQSSLGCQSYYLDSGYGPLFPFGYGLSYTNFEYSPVSIDKEVYSHNDIIKASVNISNTGKYDAEEVAQLYIRDLVGSVARPIRELKRFARVQIKAGETVKVDFELPVSELAFWNIDNKKVVESGDFQLWISTDSDSGKPTRFTVE